MTLVSGAPRQETWRDRVPRPMIVARLRDVRQRPQPGQRLRALRMGDPWFAGLVVVWAFVIAGSVAAQQWQALATIVWVPGFAMLFVQWPAIGTGMLFGIWVFAPFLRRLLDIVAPALGVDLLSLTPFMCTLSLAYIAYRKYKPPLAINVAVATVLLGYGVGSITGLAAPFALLFGLFAYCSAVFGVYIGYANGRERRFTMEQVLMPLVLISSLYGIYQGLVSQLPIWDQTWLLSHTFVSVGSKETGNFRVFSVLNSPYTYASLVAVYLAVLFVSRRVTPVRLLTGVVALMGIFLTQSRGAWVSVVGGLVIITFFTGGKALPRLIGLALTLVGMYVALGSTPAGTAVVQRAASVGAGSNDVSGKSRIGALTTLGPPALAAPIGSGIGSVGAASVINPNPKASLVDNGYLIMLVQVGPIGFILLGGGIFFMIWTVLKGSTVEDRKSLVPLLAPIGVYIPLSFFSETLYGIPGFILFYALGEALGRRYVEPPPPPGPPGSLGAGVPVAALGGPNGAGMIEGQLVGAAGAAGVVGDRTAGAAATGVVDGVGAGAGTADADPLARRTSRPALPPPLLKK